MVCVHFYAVYYLFTMSLPIVVISEPIAQTPQLWLQNKAKVVDISGQSREALLKQLATAQALVVRTYTVVDRELLEQAPQLRVIARAGVGLDNIDLQACKERDIKVVYTPMANTQAVVEYTTQMMLRALRSIEPIENGLDPKNWHKLRDASVAQRSCVGARFGIIGLGKIGSAVARVAAALGMEVVFFDLDQPLCVGGDGSEPKPTDLFELASSCDVVSIHVDGRASNHHFFSSAFFEQLNERVVLVNTSRGFVIDEQAAASFASTHPLATLILDVHDPEPVLPGSVLEGLSNVLRTAHIAAGTTGAKEKMSWVVRDVMRVLDGQDPEHPAF